jgi:hypothetical protein
MALKLVEVIFQPAAGGRPFIFKEMPKVSPTRRILADYDEPHR